MASWIHGWLDRHRHPVSLGLHIIAIPTLPVAGVLLVIGLTQGRTQALWWALGLVIVSYALQWIGHRVEGNDMGEVILIKKLLGRPYVAVSPRYQKTETDQTPERS